MHLTVQNQSRNFTQEYSSPIVNQLADDTKKDRDANLKTYIKLKNFDKLGVGFISYNGFFKNQFNIIREKRPGN